MKIPMILLSIVVIGSFGLLALAAPGFADPNVPYIAPHQHFVVTEAGKWIPVGPQCEVCDAYGDDDWPFGGDPIVEDCVRAARTSALTASVAEVWQTISPGANATSRRATRLAAPEALTRRLPQIEPAPPDG